MPLNWNFEEELQGIAESYSSSEWGLSWHSRDISYESKVFRRILTEEGTCQTFNMLPQDEIMKTEM